jgi:adenylosuccinate lyase
MKKVFDEESRLEKMLKVEAALARALASTGAIPKTDADAINAAATIKNVSVEKVAKLEEEVRHDVMALVKALAQSAGASGRFVHMGATSNDIIDTATALQLKEAVGIIREDLFSLRDVLVRLANRYKATVMIGRTHGQSAIPLTFGLKMAVFAGEIQRHIERLSQAEPRICVGKMSGAVGTGAAFGVKALEVQELVMKELGLQAEFAATQVVGRDRYAELVFILASVASSLEKFATEIRNLQRSEIKEVAESFDIDRQVGSSTMANKQNPITCENICGLARIVRSYVTPALENMPLWHERDLTNSSAERFILPHACILADDIIVKMASVFSSLRVYPENMKANIERTNGQVMAESVMIALTRKGMNRQDAHELLRKAAIEAEAKKLHLKQVLEKNRMVSRHLTKKELTDAMNPYRYIGAAKEIVENVTAEARKQI